MRFHSIIAYFQRLAAAIRTVRGQEPKRPAARPRPAPFCTGCGVRTRPYDPDDADRHRRCTATVQQ